MSTGRKRKDYQRWQVLVRTPLAAQVELILQNPLKGQVRYGAKSDLVNALLQGWVNQKINEHRKQHQQQLTDGGNNAKAESGNGGKDSGLP